MCHFLALFVTATGIDITRTTALLGITGTTLLPLCLLKNLSSLAPFSLVGVTGMLYTSIAMATRYFQGAYKLGSPAMKKAAAVPAGKFLINVPKNLQPQFGDLGASAAWTSPNVFILICMLSTAYMAREYHLVFVVACVCVHVLEYSLTNTCRRLQCSQILY